MDTCKTCLSQMCIKLTNNCILLLNCNFSQFLSLLAFYNYKLLHHNDLFDNNTIALEITVQSFLLISK